MLPRHCVVTLIGRRSSYGYGGGGEENLLRPGAYDFSEEELVM